MPEEKITTVEVTSNGVYTTTRWIKKRAKYAWLIGISAVVLGAMMLYIIIKPDVRCSLSGGEWKNFNSGCINSCPIESGKKKYGIQCFAEVVNSCLCERGKCWNGQYCETITYD